MDHDQAQCARYHLEVLASQMRAAGADERSLHSLRAEYIEQAMQYNHLLHDVIRYSEHRGSEVHLVWNGQEVSIDAGSLVTSVAAAEELLLSAERDIEGLALGQEVVRLRAEVAELKKNQSN